MRANVPWGTADFCFMDSTCGLPTGRLSHVLWESNRKLWSTGGGRRPKSRRAQTCHRARMRDYDGTMKASVAAMLATLWLAPLAAEEPPATSCILQADKTVPVKPG